MLLAVLDLAEAGALTNNRIYYERNPRLIESFLRYFDIVQDPSRHVANPFEPFVHLASDSFLSEEKFWFLVPYPGKEQGVSEKPSKGGTSRSWVIDNVQYSYLHEKVHNTILDPICRSRLRHALIATYFQNHAHLLSPELELAEKENKYEDLLRQTPRVEIPQPMIKHVRSQAFRQLVLEAYDYRCAASGWRVIVPRTRLIDAAHLIPFNDSHDDNPRNGIALTPTFHRALDASLIAPGPDHKWKISKILKDTRIPDFRPFQELAGKDVILPDGKYKPNPEALRWRVENLRVD